MTAAELEPVAAIASAPEVACEVVLQNPGEYPEVTTALAGWVSDLASGIAADSSAFGLRFVDDAEMTELNRRYRQIDGTTDVLSFPGEESPEGRYLGDVVISVPQARRQAESRGHAVDRELRVLVLHGVLHCQGHDHETDDGAMERLEIELRRQWIDRDV